MRYKAGQQRRNDPAHHAIIYPGPLAKWGRGGIKPMTSG